MQFVQNNQITHTHNATLLLRMVNRKENIMNGDGNQKNMEIEIIDEQSNQEENSDISEKKIKREYQSLVSMSGITSGNNTATRPNNVRKNRYDGVYANDRTRVLLFGRDPDRHYDGNYINANYVSNVNNSKKFIACQAPISETILDFWHMVFVHSTRLIIMLTDLVENGVMKAHKYWPDMGNVFNCDYFSVEYKTKKCLQGVNNIVIREFELRHFHVDISRKVYQIQYLGWPDYGVPDSVEDVLLLMDVAEHLQYLDHEKERGQMECIRNSPPMIAHCSAGIGRTGTFIAVYNCISSLKRNGKCVIANVVNLIRQQRHGSVTGERQYEFIYKTIVHVIEKYQTVE